MKVGDLVRVQNCPKPDDDVLRSGLDFECKCFFCMGNSCRIGYVLSPAPHNSWNVQFDCGQWRLDMFDEARGEVEVICESR